MIGLVSTLRAESIRTRGSAASLLPLLGLVIAGISAAGILVTPESQGRAALLWQTLYVTGMAAGLLSLLAGLTTARETAARQGGTHWRPVNPSLVVIARFLVLAGLSALFHMLAFWTVIPVSLAAGAPVDIAGILSAGAGCWIATLGVLALAFVASERWGAVPVFLAACFWQAIGTLAAEWSAWPLIPPTWAIRAMLPLLGAHQNGEPLAPDDPLAHESPTLAMTLAIALMVAAIAFRLVDRDTGRSDRRTDARPIGRRSSRPSTLGAITTTMRGRPILPLCAAAIVVCLATAIVYPADYLLGFHTYALLPLGACVTATLLWQTLAPGWRLLVLRRATVPAAVQTWLTVCVSVVTVIVFVLVLINLTVRGDSTIEAWRVGTLWLILGTAGALAALWVTVRFGIGWALGAAIIFTIVGATFGGDVLAESWLWLLGPTAWPLSADTPARFATACGLGLLAVVAAWALSRQALTTVTARGG